MKIIKRNGEYQSFAPNKILTRIKTHAKDLKNVDADYLFQKVIPLVHDGMNTTDIDEIIAFTAADLIIEHFDYSTLGGRILLSRQSKIINKELQEIDKTYDFFSATTFLTKYSVKNDLKQPIELPSCMMERVAGYLSDTPEEYELFATELKSKKSNCATPIYTNAGTERKALISCNLTTNISDDFEGIEQTLTNTAKASKEGAGIGILLDNIRSEESIVSSFKGNASGVVRYADMLQSKMRFYKQGVRSGSAAMYLSLWHKDIIKFLELKLLSGDEKLRTRDLFTAVVINDVFMRCLEEEKDWYLFCPNDIFKAKLKPLQTLHGVEFEEEYQKAVNLKIGKAISPKTIWDAVIKSQVESGNPYVLYKDNANKRNMQDNIGTITMSNLCIEILQASKPNYTPQCALSSVNLAEHTTLDSIANSVSILVKMLNKVIDKNVWSDEASKAAGMDQRAIAIGVAGLADFFYKKKIAFDSEEAKRWTNDIFETMYKYALLESSAIAEKMGKNYPAYENSKYSKGETYIENWKTNFITNIPMANSLLIGLMPTASSAILNGSYESFQPIDSNIFTRRVGQGEFLVINKYLVKDLQEIGMWTKEIRDKIVRNKGSIQTIMDIPENIRTLYKTVWEISQKTLIDLAVIRNKYVDQSQSMNLYFADAKYGKISGALMYGWKQGLKTGVYYTRTDSKLANSTKLAGVSEEIKLEKPKDSPFDCFGCSA